MIAKNMPGVLGSGVTCSTVSNGVITFATRFDRLHEDDPIADRFGSAREILRRELVHLPRPIVVD